ncbi:MAG: hypothetical protein ACRC2J_05370 [Microcoleaceae cyanobacterium]
MANLKKDFSTSVTKGAQKAGGTWKAGTGTNTTGMDLSATKSVTPKKARIPKVSKVPGAMGAVKTNTTLASGMNTLKTNMANMKNQLATGKANLASNIANMKVNTKAMKTSVPKIKRKKGTMV